MAAMNPDSIRFYYTCNGRTVSTPEELLAARLSGLPLRAWPRLPGGKGGFGSLLRSIGSQIDKTTNREMCRDLSGRRIRDVNNQKRLTDWAAGAGARAAERQKRREEKRRRRRDLLASADGPAGHVMQDGRYLVEKERMVDTVFSAVQAALKSRKRPADEAGASAATGSASASAVSSMGALAAGPSRAPKAARKWLEADLQDLEGSSSSASSSSDSEDSAQSDPTAQATGSWDEQEESPKSPPAEAAAAAAAATADQGEVAAEPQAHDAPESTEVDDAKQASVEAKPDEEQQQLCDLAPLDSLEAAERLGLEALKAQLRLRGLKCSGSLRERAQRLLAVRGLSPDRYPAGLLAARPRSK